jgi:hypothetical protein
LSWCRRFDIGGGIPIFTDMSCFATIAVVVPRRETPVAGL